MPVPFTCPHCGKITQVADAFVGQSGPCTACGVTVTIAVPARPLASQAPANQAGSAALIGTLLALFGLLVCGGVGVILLIPANVPAKEAARRMSCVNNLKQIALALHNYHDVNKSFPPAYTVDQDGNKLHSWRTLILPYLEQGALYDQVDWNSPWDSPQNWPISQTVIPTYCCPSTDDANYPTRTNYMAVVGSGAIFDGANSNSFAKILDGSSNTMIVVEVTAGSPTSWMEPADLDLETMIMAINGGLGEMGSRHPGGLNVALADGSVRFIEQTTDADLLRSLISCQGGEIIPEF